MRDWGRLARHPRLTTRFDDAGAGVIHDFTGSSETVLIAFGGISGQIGVPVYEFFNIAEGFGVKKIFVRDHRRSWYHRGVAQLGHDIVEVGVALQKLLTGSTATRVVTVGNSAGGYAALLYGELLDAAAVLAFVPQTFISPALRHGYRDGRWPAEIARLTASGCLDERYADLRTVLRSARPQGTRIYFSPRDQLDVVHARHVADLPGLQLRSYEHGGHGMVRHMRDNGDLSKVLASVLS